MVLVNMSWTECSKKTGMQTAYRLPLGLRQEGGCLDSRLLCMLSFSFYLKGIEFVGIFIVYVCTIILESI